MEARSRPGSCDISLTVIPCAGDSNDPNTMLITLGLRVLLRHEVRRRCMRVSGLNSPLPTITANLRTPIALGLYCTRKSRRRPMIFWHTLVRSIGTHGSSTCLPPIACCVSEMRPGRTPTSVLPALLPLLARPRAPRGLEEGCTPPSRGQQHQAICWFPSWLGLSSSCAPR